ncbi:hypothetical protein [Deinococcus ruber]|uniref:Uncharacterized protein n=1 Tax=Deinococcus ruber TaxID=1848197 RepID=A0A918C2I2_9DEIO|nr:hypothetical protein [Deinococcus ruber]GGR04033.1 hypothetical protein GCM10008957_16240 [Deinococcus ruber]
MKQTLLYVTLLLGVVFASSARAESGGAGLPGGGVHLDGSVVTVVIPLPPLPLH